MCEYTYMCLECDTYAYVKSEVLFQEACMYWHYMQHVLCLVSMHTYTQNKGYSEVHSETQGKRCQSSSASLYTSFKLILSHCAFINLSLLPNFAPSSHWVAWPQIVMTQNLRNCSGCSWDTRFDSRHWSRVESRGEGKSRPITISHTLMDSQDHCIQDRKYSGGTLVNIKYVLMINHQQKNSTRNIKWKTSEFQSDTFEYSRFKANTWMGKNHNGDQKNEFSHRSPRTCLWSPNYKQWLWLQLEESPAYITYHCHLNREWLCLYPIDI